MSLDRAIDSHYGFGGIFEKIEAGLGLAGKQLNSICVDDLAPIDEFHTRGRESTLELVELAQVRASDSVLDVGCGLGGSARHLAEEAGCTVTGIDLTDEYIEVGKRLNALVGLDENAKEKLQNYVTNLSEDRTSVAMGRVRKG